MSWFTFGILDVSSSIPSYVHDPSGKISVGMGGKYAPSTTYQFGGGHIPPYTMYKTR